LADKLKSGYLDLVFTLAQTDARRNLVADWNEKLAWTSAEHFVVDTSELIPFIGRAAGFIDRKALQILDDHDVPYRIAFVAEDLSSLSAAVEAGIGVMVVPERVVPAPLIVVRDSVLPMLPDLRAGVFFSEGFDLKHNKQLVESFVSAVQPLPVATNVVACRARRSPTPCFDGHPRCRCWRSPRRVTMPKCSR
jgi:DNA-binding transcriptional LysR family regulator